MNTTYKQKIIDHIKSIDKENRYGDFVLPFIQAYDGNDDLTFNKFMLCLTTLIQRAYTHSKDLEHLKKLEDAIATYQKTIAELKAQYKVAKTNQDVPAYLFPAPSDELLALEEQLDQAEQLLPAQDSTTSLVN